MSSSSAGTMGFYCGFAAASGSEDGAHDMASQKNSGNDGSRLVCLVGGAAIFGLAMAVFSFTRVNFLQRFRHPYEGSHSRSFSTFV